MTKIKSTTLIPVILGVLVVGVVTGWIISNNLNGNPIGCVTEFGHVTTGTLFDGKCCSGLEAKAPLVFTGGAWCVTPAYEVKCTDINNIKGIYAIEKVSNGNKVLLIQLDCQVQCGGIAGIQCPVNYHCVLDNSNMDSMGLCYPIGDVEECFKIENRQCVQINSFSTCGTAENSYLTLQDCQSHIPPTPIVNSTRLYCNDNGNMITVCYDIYNPVCGDDMITYSNNCLACVVGEVNYYTMGVC
jgi:hypothetical protein